jgi:DNA-binding GntR family transcriptional regulator
MADRPPAADASVSLIEQSAQALRGDIMRGRLRPGQKLVEGELCRAMGISRASLRETLRALEAERLIELIPHRGPFVAKLGWKEVQDIHDVWALLTSEAVARFADIAQDKDIAQLQAARDRISRSLQSKDPLVQLEATNGFFRYILHRNENDVLIDMVESLVSRVNFLRAQALHLQSWGQVCLREVDEILAAIGAKQPRQAHAAAVRHITSAATAAKQALVMADTSAPAKAVRFTRSRKAAS